MKRLQNYPKETTSALLKRYKSLGFIELQEELAKHEKAYSNPKLKTLMGENILGKIEVLNRLLNKQKIVLDKESIKGLEAIVKSIKKSTKHSAITWKLSDSLLNLIKNNQGNMYKPLYAKINKALMKIKSGKKMKGFVEIEDGEELYFISINSEGITICGEDEYGKEFEILFGWHGDFDGVFEEDEDSTLNKYDKDGLRGIDLKYEQGQFAIWKLLVEREYEKFCEDGFVESVNIYVK